MNSLSWFLYWIDVLGSLSAILSVGSVLLIVALIATWIICGLGIEDIHDNNARLAIRKERRAWTWRFAIMSASCAVIASFMPSKGTMYAIAASQVGEQVVKSEAVQGMASDAQKALQQWIKKQIEPEKKS